MRAIPLYDSLSSLRSPHALPQIGYDVLLRNQSVFQCYYDLRDTIFHSELGSTLAILGAGYTIDSLMLRYQGVDWRNKDNWNCNGGCVHTTVRGRSHQSQSQHVDGCKRVHH